MYGHRRERSSLSTNCSQSSGHSRVLPFATARTRDIGHMESIAETPDTQMYISDNHRFALAQPRRVITQPTKFGHRMQPNKRHSASIGISTLLTEKSSRHGTRVRPIIGLGLTLNPADALVRIQSRRSITTTRIAQSESTRSSVVLSEAFSYASPALESCVSLTDLSPYTDPQFVHTRSVKRTHAQSEQMAKDSWQSSPDSVESEAVPSIRSEPSSHEPSRTCLSVCCLLCFEQTRIAPHSRNTKCPACNSRLLVRSTR
ncbi:hypothetical protein IW136_000554 [Coemansia sp. RSA 678]|nr:hypothetical protein IW136_000554 [Coemansia sp. RSA 678]